MSNLSVVIPTYRNPECLDICLKSATENRAKDTDIIVVVDGYLEESKDVLERYSDKVKILDLGKNYGMQHALNVGVYSAETEYVLIVNDDNVFPKDWDIILDKIRTEKCVITPNQIEPSGPSIFNFPIVDYGMVNGFEYDRFVREEQKIRKKMFSADGGIFPFLMEKKWFVAVGGFDVLYPSPFICDWDFFLRLEMIGLEFMRSHHLHFYHFGSVATKNRTDGEEFKFKMSENKARETWLFKWGFNPPLRENNSHKPSGTHKGINFDK